MRLRKTWIFLFLAAMVLFIYLTVEVRSGNDLSFDKNVKEMVTVLFPERVFPIFNTMDVLGSRIGVGIVSLLTVLWLWGSKRNYAAMATLAFAVVLGNEWNKWLKDMIGRQRPDEVHLAEVSSLSFPSGHAMMGMILYFMIAYFIIKSVHNRTVKWIAGTIAAILILLLGISRIALNVHYPTDIVGGIAAGFLWASIWLVIYEVISSRLLQRKEKRASSE